MATRRNFRERRETRRTEALTRMQSYRYKNSAACRRGEPEPEWQRRLDQEINQMVLRS